MWHSISSLPVAVERDSVERERESRQSVESLSQRVYSAQRPYSLQRDSAEWMATERAQYVEASPAVSYIRYHTQRGSVWCQHRITVTQ